MATVIGTRLKAIRERAGLRSRDVADMLKMPASTYQKYEDRYDRPYLPLHIVAKLVNALKIHGISARDIWQLADDGHVDAFMQAWAAREADGAGEPVTERPVMEHWRSQNGGGRQYERWQPLAASISLDGDRHRCVVGDISPNGASVWADTDLDLGKCSEVKLELGEFGEVAAQVARFTGKEIGLAFQGNKRTERDIAG